MAERVYKCLGQVITAKKRSWYKRESKWRILLNDRIINKVEDGELTLFVVKLRGRLYKANAVHGQMTKSLANEVGITMHYPTWELSEIYSLNTRKGRAIADPSK